MYDKRFQSSDLFDFATFPLQECSKYEINHNFRTICHTEVKSSRERTVLIYTVVALQKCLKLLILSLAHLLDLYFVHSSQRELLREVQEPKSSAVTFFGPNSK